MINRKVQSYNYSDLWRLCDTWGVDALTHEELQGYVVDEDVIQRDDTQLSKVGCQLKGINLLHNTGAE